MNTNIKGTINEIKVQIRLMELGYIVFTPISDGSEIDFIAIHKEGNIVKIQVKIAIKTKKGFNIDYRRHVGVKRSSYIDYNEKIIDMFSCVFEDKVYLIPYEIARKRKFHFTVVPKKYRNCLIGDKYII